jgi:hypothetical protein
MIVGFYLRDASNRQTPPHTFALPPSSVDPEHDSAVMLAVVRLLATATSRACLVGTPYGSAEEADCTPLARRSLGGRPYGRRWSHHQSYSEHRKLMTELVHATHLPRD